MFSSNFWIVSAVSTVRENTAVLPWAGTRSDADVLRALVVIIGLCWSLAFVIVALEYDLQLYGDGAMFSYAVAAQDVWAFHWHNISGRLTVFLLTLWPAELFAGATGNPWNGVMAYGFLFYVAQLVGLFATFSADRSRNRIIFTYACFSTALLCPLVFGFPTEMWMAHALFWPALAIAHYARRGALGTAFVFLMLLTLTLTHEGALVLALTIVATTALRGAHDPSFRRAAGAMVAVLMVWVEVKMLLPPGNYFAGVFVAAALHFFDPETFEVNIVFLLGTSLAGYGLAFAVLSRLVPGKAHLWAAAIVAAILAVYWFGFDQAILADHRYYMRTVLVIVTPALGVFATFYALRADGLAPHMPGLPRVVTAFSNGITAEAFAGAFMIVTLVYAVETGQFVSAWTDYKAAVKTLAIGTASDPPLGDPHFVSSGRIDADLNRLSWFSTTQYLSVIAANFAPNRLVVDPANAYFWLSCETATANSTADRLIPAASRELVRTYSCLHR
jgi:hypothetical protein